jgi:hypothetical protein
MLTSGKPGDAVWMVIDTEVVRGRLVRIFADPDSLASGLRVDVRYSDQTRGNIRGNFAEHVYANGDYKAAKAFAES